MALCPLFKVEEVFRVDEGEEVEHEKGGGGDNVSDSGTETSAASTQPASSPPLASEDVLHLHASDEEVGMIDQMREDGEITSDTESGPLTPAKRRVEPREDNEKRAKSEAAEFEPRKPVHQRLGAFKEIEGRVMRSNTIHWGNECCLAL